MKVGDLVRYKLYPHAGLFESSMTGVILSAPYKNTHIDHPEMIIDVVWSNTRLQAIGGITWDYVGELEVVNEAV